MITLLSIFRNPALFKTAVAMVPVTNLFQRLAWKGVERQHQLIDPQNRYGGLPFEKQDVYKDRSPLYNVDKLQIPLYVGVTKNDQDVNIEEDMQLVDALRARKPRLAETMVYDNPPGGHTFDRRVDPKHGCPRTRASSAIPGTGCGRSSTGTWIRSMPKCIRVRAAVLAVTIVTAASLAVAAAQDALPRVRLLATGGTISNRTGGRLTAEELVKSMPGLERYAQPEYEQFTNLASSQLTLDQWVGLAKRVNELEATDRTLAVMSSPAAPIPSKSSPTS